MRGLTSSVGGSGAGAVCHAVSCRRRPDVRPPCRQSPLTGGGGVGWGPLGGFKVTSLFRDYVVGL